LVWYLKDYVTAFSATWLYLHASTILLAYSMKTPLLLGSLLSLAHIASAQEAKEALLPSRQFVGVGIFGLSPNVGVQYEYRFARHFSVSMQGARYFSNYYPGYQVALLGRYYFRALRPNGFYLQGSWGAYHHNAQMEADMPGFYSVHPQVLKGSGPALGLGYQLRLRQHLALQATVGLKLYLHDIGIKCDCAYVGDWYADGQPGSVFDTQLGVGYTF
jgi:hypothetical protein